MIDIFALILVVLLAVVFHEVAHGVTALAFGDPTAKLAGRLTLNPIKHIDPIGSIIVPGILVALMILGQNRFVFAWAKPVPVNFGRLRNPKRDMIWVALAGPAVNILLAVGFSLILNVNMPLNVFLIIVNAIFINLLLAIFNLIPIPPLDGSRVVMGLLPNRWIRPYARLEPFGILIVFALLPTGLYQSIVLPAVNYCGNLLGVNFL